MKIRSLFRIILILSILSAGAFPLRAQWSGNVDVSAGFGGMMGDKEKDIGFLGHLVAKEDFTLRYQTDKFSWSTSVNCRFEPKSSDNSRLSMSKNKEDELGLELVYKTVKTRPLQTGIRTEFGWKPKTGQNYSAWISYRYTNDRARNVSNSLSGTLTVDEQEMAHYFESPRDLVNDLRLDAMGSHLASIYYETPRMDEHNMSTGARGEWLLGPKSLLQSSFSISSTGSKKLTTWSVFKTTGTNTENLDIYKEFREGNAWMYRITPNTIDLDFMADIHLRQTVRSDSVRLHWSPGIKVTGNHSLDNNSGATLQDISPEGEYVWKDSLRLRENFNFLSLFAAPYVAMEYHGKKIDVIANYAIQFYMRRLNDDSRKQPLMFLNPNIVGSSSFTWKISPVHKLGITHGVGADYPDYLKICWYDRTGGYADQLYRGNTDLLSTIHSRYGMTYELNYKGFRYSMVNAVTRRINEIDQTWSNEEIEGRLYKVFRWVNSADSWSFGTSHRIAWEGKWLRAGVGINYNQSRRKAKSDGARRDASDWSLTADANANLGKGWTIGADARYQSSVATFFTRFNEYWALNGHVQKSFKKVTLYLDARDLLDSARQSIVESDNGEQLLVDVARGNRRLFLLGVRWNF